MVHFCFVIASQVGIFASSSIWSVIIIGQQELFIYYFFSSHWLLTFVINLISEVTFHSQSWFEVGWLHFCRSLDTFQLILLQGFDPMYDFLPHQKNGEGKNRNWVTRLGGKNVSVQHELPFPFLAIKVILVFSSSFYFHLFFPILSCLVTCLRSRNWYNKLIVTKDSSITHTKGGKVWKRGSHDAKLVLVVHSEWSWELFCSIKIYERFSMKY